MRASTNCRCGDPLVFREEPDHCFRCGKGPFTVVFTGRASRMRRLPWDLGALQREGRRPDPNLENVVRLDRLRRPKAPVLTLVAPADHREYELRRAA